MEAGVTADMLTDVVDSIFTTMMDLAIAPINASWELFSERLTACVYLEGDWNGAVSIECSTKQAREFAGRFMAIDGGEVVDDDMRDVLGEIANMIGGNFKSILAKDVRLSMPSVIDGSSYELRFCGADVQHRIAFSDTAGGAFWVTVLCRNNTPKPTVN